MTKIGPNYIDRLALLDFKDKKVLLALSKKKDTWFVPGGKREKGETDKEALMISPKEQRLELRIILENILAL